MASDPATAPTLTPARIAVVTFAQSVLGYTAPSDEYQELILPGDTDEQQDKLDSMSGCMLVTLGIQDNVFAVPERGPYANGSAPRLLQARAQGYPWAPGGALRLATRDAPPQPGDAVWFGKSPVADEHVETVIEAYVVGTRMNLVCVAGGDKDKRGRQTIIKVTRLLFLTTPKGQWVDVANGRPIIGVIDAEEMERLYGLREPG